MAETPASATTLGQRVLEEDSKPRGMGDDALLLPDFGEPGHEVVELSARDGALALEQIYSGSLTPSHAQSQQDRLQGAGPFLSQLRNRLPNLPLAPLCSFRINVRRM